jgi:hypothetical protein
LWFLLGGAAFLVSLVTNGVGFATAFSYPFAGKIGFARLLLLLALPWVVVGVPDQAFKLRLDRGGTGDARRVTVNLITGLSCVLTGIYLVLLHFPGGPLHKIPRGQLVTGILVTVLLVAPFYRSIARICWQWGITGFFSREAVRGLGGAAAEVWKAMSQPPGPQTKTSNENAPAGMNTQDTAVHATAALSADAECPTSAETQPPTSASPATPQ